MKQKDEHRLKNRKLAQRSEMRRSDWIRNTLDVIEGDVHNGDKKRIGETKQLVQAFIHGNQPTGVKIKRNPNIRPNDSGFIQHDQPFLPSQNVSQSVQLNTWGDRYRAIEPNRDPRGETTRPRYKAHDIPIGTGTKLSCHWSGQNEKAVALSNATCSTFRLATKSSYVITPTRRLSVTDDPQRNSQTVWRQSVRGKSANTFHGVQILKQPNEVDGVKFQEQAILFTNSSRDELEANLNDPDNAQPIKSKKPWGKMYSSLENSPKNEPYIGDSYRYKKDEIPVALTVSKTPLNRYSRTIEAPNHDIDSSVSDRAHLLCLQQSLLNHRKLTQRRQIQGKTPGSTSIRTHQYQQLMDTMANKLSNHNAENSRRRPKNQNYTDLSPRSTNSSTSLGRRMSFTIKLDPNELVKKYLKLNVHPTERTGHSSKQNTDRGQKTVSGSSSLRQGTSKKTPSKKQVTIHETASNEQFKPRNKPATAAEPIRKTYYGSLICKINPKILQLDRNQDVQERQKLLEQLRNKLHPINTTGIANDQERENSPLSHGISFDDDIEDISIKTDGEQIDDNGKVDQIDKAFKKLQQQKDKMQRFTHRQMLKGNKKKTDEPKAQVALKEMIKQEQ